MLFRNAREEEVPMLMGMVQDAVRYFRDSHIDQWQHGYPDADTLYEDIRLGRLFVVEKAEAALGMLAILTEPDPSYEKVWEGAWPNDLPYLSLHRVCVSFRHKGQGIAGELFRGAEAWGRQQGFASFRVDTHADNRPMQRCLEKAGYVRCGLIHLVGGAEDGAPRIIYQKTVAPAESQPAESPLSRI